MCKQIAYLLGFISFIECMEMTSDKTNIKIEKQVTIISANLIKNLLNMKLVSDICDSQNYQILNMQMSEMEMNAVLLETKPFFFKMLNKKINLKFCNPQVLKFRLIDIFNSAIYFQYCKISLDFRKNVKRL